MRSHSARVARCIAAAVAVALGATMAAGAASARPSFPGYEYISPVPGSRYVSPENNIILRSGRKLNRGLLNQVAISVVGSVSGSHAGTLDVSDDRETVLFQPDQPFAQSEVVTVTVTPRVRGNAPLPLDPLEFQFTVSDNEPASMAATALRYSARDVVDDSDPGTRSLTRGGAPAVLGGDLLSDLPQDDDIPQVAANVDVARTTGHLFMAAFRGLEQELGYLVILDDYRNVVFYRRLYRGATDFKVQPNGWITYWTSATETSDVPRYYVMDTRGVLVDSIQAGNGYEIDLHELRVLPNGHLLVLSYDPQRVRMDLEVPGGKPNAIVLGLVVQELDLRRRVVFQWRSWDAYAFTDLRDGIVSLTGATVDWVHGNSIDFEPNGDLIISARHLNEITKVSRRTGETIWRLGERAANNDFTFVNDDRGFSHQHHVRLLPDGHLTMFDNGNFIAPAMSRAVEYELDQTNHIARLVWEYHHQPSVYGGFLGSVQRFDDGGTLICWGGTFGPSRWTELLPDGTVAYDGGFRPNTWNTYRVLRGPWRTTRITTNVEAIDFGALSAGATVTRSVVVRNPGPDPIEINSVSTVGDPAFHASLDAPVTLAVGATMEVAVDFTAPGSGEAQGRLYVGTAAPTDLLLQEVNLRGGSTGGLAARSRAPVSGLSSVRAESDGAGSTIRFSLARPSRVDVAVFGVDGRRVATLQSGELGAGEHAATWRSAGHPDGVYFVQVRSDEGTITRKLAVVH